MVHDHVPPRPGASVLPCPNTECARTFTCEACLHEHMVEAYGVRYFEVYGFHDPAYVSFCRAHQGLSPSVLGI